MIMNSFNEWHDKDEIILKYEYVSKLIWKKLVVYEDNVFKLKLMVIVFIWTIKSDILFQLSSPKYFDGKDTTLTWKVFGLSGYIFLWVIPYEYLWHRTMLPPKYTNNVKWDIQKVKVWKFHNLTSCIRRWV